MKSVIERMKEENTDDAAPVVHGKWISNSSLNKCSEANARTTGMSGALSGAARTGEGE
ncbi:hypothetical protein CE91St46_07540 [Eubacteriales bacterium]|nr:hypothetical protein [Faecalicatena sp. BF-R-105]GKH49643.1 hypothetical protein CE91St46_07540 [Eubacteriales bacterium]GKH62284.1 hypothetical protein CE91St47_07530 [Eubacteriales bacterium]